MKRENILVTSFNGESVPMSECRCIKGVYYIKNKECFFISGKWYRINSGLIVFNYTTNEYVLKTDSSLNYNTINGIVKFDGSKPIFGYFSENLYTNTFVYLPDTGETKKALNDRICIDALLTIDPKIGVYVVPPTTERGRVNLSDHRANFINNYKHSLSYRAENAIEDALSLFIKNYKLKSPVSGFSQYLPFSWGLEFETVDGVIPPNLLHSHGLIPLRDGSIPGLEYATVPLKGERGIQNTLDICNLLSKYTRTGFDCSFHVHLGGYERSIPSILALYTLGASIQNDMYSYFPSWYKNTGVYKRRSYVGPLNAIDHSKLGSAKEFDLFASIYSWYSGGHKFSSLETTRHPGDPNSEHKWTIEQRYLWLNLIPLIFSNRGTVEFRIHPPTNSDVKVFNWILICSSILNYATKNQSELIKNGFRKITLSEVLSDVLPKEIASYLITYMESRKATFSKLEASGDGPCKSDIDNDYLYKYKSIFEL